MFLTWEKKTLQEIGFTQEQIGKLETIELKDLPEGIDEIIYGLLKYATHTNQFINTLKYNIDSNYAGLK